MVLFMHELDVFKVLNVTGDQLTDHTTNNSCPMTSAQPMSVVSKTQSLLPKKPECGQDWVEKAYP